MAYKSIYAIVLLFAFAAHVHGGYTASDYQIGTLNSNSCSEGALITDEESCKDAAVALGKSFKETASWSDEPRGCQLADNDVYFNTHSTGAEHATIRPVCFTAVTTLQTDVAGLQTNVTSLGAAVAELQAGGGTTALNELRDMVQQLQATVAQLQAAAASSCNVSGMLNTTVKQQYLREEYQKLGGCA